MSTASPAKSDIVTVLISKTNSLNKNVIMLDTQSPIHLVSNAQLLTDISMTHAPIVVQGITGDKVKVIHEGFINDIGVNAYYGSNMAANILSYHKLQETHFIQYDGDQGTFCAIPALVGPTLIFSCVNGHYILDLVIPSSIQDQRQSQRCKVLEKAATCSKKGL